MKNKSVGYIIETTFPNIRIDDRGSVIILSLPNVDSHDFICYISKDIWESDYINKKGVMLKL